MQKVHLLNFSIDFLNSVFNYLTHRQHLVHINSNCSSLLTDKFHVRQGSILVLKLFNLCVAKASISSMSSISPTVIVCSAQMIQPLIDVAN